MANDLEQSLARVSKPWKASSSTTLSCNARLRYKERGRIPKGRVDATRLAISHILEKYSHVLREVIEVLVAGEGFGHPMMAPPGTPADRVKILRDAYSKALSDPELVAEAQKGGWLIEPVSGEELQRLAERIMVQPPDVVNQVKKILRVK